MKNYTIDPAKCLEHLKGMVMIPTVSNANPDLQDFTKFDQLHAYLEQSYPLVHKTLKREIIGRAGLLYTWKGTGKSSQHPLLLAAHQDVVPEGDHALWTYAPYSGTVADGKLWGRGTTDSKNNIMAILDAAEALIASGFQPDYDIYFAFGCNEEVMGGSRPSAREISETLEARGVRLGCVIDECGGCGTGEAFGIDGTICNITIAEKGYADYEFIKRDKGGHSSTPAPNGALLSIAKTILALEEHPFPNHVIPVIKEKFKVLAPFMEGEKARIFSDVEANWEEVLPYLAEDRKLAAMFHTTVALSMTHGSAQANILPEVASLIVNTRPLPGDSLEYIEKTFRDIIPEDVEVHLLKGGEASPVSLTDSHPARLLRKMSEERYPGCTTIYDCMLGGTDARYYYTICDCVYRFSSFYHTPEWGPAHCVNECIPIDCLAGGAEFFAEYMTRYGLDGE